MTENQKRLELSLCKLADCMSMIFRSSYMAPVKDGRQTRFVDLGFALYIYVELLSVNVAAFCMNTPVRCESLQHGCIRAEDDFAQQSQMYLIHPTALQLVASHLLYPSMVAKPAPRFAIKLMSAMDTDRPLALHHPCSGASPRRRSFAIFCAFLRLQLPCSCTTGLSS